MGVAQKYINGALAFYDEAVTHRLIDVIGPDVTKYMMKPGDDFDATQGAFVITATGTSPITAAETVGKLLLITTGGTEYDGDSMQLHGEPFKIVAGKPLYFGAKLEVSDATQCDLLIGLCKLDTTLLNASASHAVNASIEGIFFLKLDGGTTLLAKSYVANAETNSATYGTAFSTTAIWLEFYFDGDTLFAFVNGSQVGSWTDGFPTEDLTVSIDFHTGSANARTLTISKLRAFYIE
jgi:hypothetical protein